MSYNKKEHKLANKKLKNGHLRKKLLITIVMFFVVAAVGGACAWCYFYSQKPTTSNSDTINPEQTAKNNYVATVTSNVQKKVTEGSSVADATLLYDEAIKASNDVETRSMLYLEKSTTYLNNGHIDEALAAALKSEAELQNENIDQYIAGIYVTKGDKQNAIKYYQKAIDLIGSDDPLSGADAQSYRELIQRLDGATN